MEDAIELSEELTELSQENIDIMMMKSYSRLIFLFIPFSYQCQADIFSDSRSNHRSP